MALINSKKMQRKIFIKNMVCPRCVEAVRKILEDLQFEIIDLKLGRVILDKAITDAQKKILQENLAKQGFELLDDKYTQLINQIKSIIIQEIHYQKEYTPVNFSTLLAEKLHYDYAYLSRLFSSIENRTIENFIIAQKIEKAKELLTYKELTLAEIAFQMNYSSAAHLSAQFKKVTGISPTTFKKENQPKRQFLDEV